IAQRDEEMERIAAADHQVKLAIAVQVGQAHRAGGETSIRWDRESLFRLKGSVATAEQHGHRAVTRHLRVDGDEIGNVVPVHVADVQAEGCSRGIKAALRLKGPVPSSKEDRDVPGIKIRDYQIELAVVVE